MQYDLLLRFVPKLFAFGLCLCGLVSCRQVEKKAGERLQQARAAYGRGDYNEAKLQIDSIGILYPKAFDARREGIRLMQEVELKEQEHTLAYLDSLLAQRQQSLEAMRSAFVLEKDTAYQVVGHYLHPSQVIEKNLHRSYLRFQVDERGQMSMTSVYCGQTPIHHVAVKVSAPDGSFAETPASADSYETTNLGEYIEKADYRLGADGSVIGFIRLNKDKDIRVDYRGERAYTTRMLPVDRQAAVAVYELSEVLGSITRIQKEREEANLKMAFIRARMEQD